MRRKYATCVGINDYPGTGADLSGCVNDATEWRDLLAEQGYDTLTLLDESATKADVVRNLEWMVATARFGDRIVFTYSGHGSWVPDNDGDEADKRDEVLCLHDFASGGLLSDDELFSIFSKRRWGVRVYIISDSCHSGTVSRFATVAQGERRFLPPSNFLPPESIPERMPRKTSRPRPGTVLLSGCDDLEYSYDAFINGRYNGAFSRVAIDQFREMEQFGVPRIDQWHSAIRRALPSASYPQSPQLAATSWQRRWSL